MSHPHHSLLSHPTSTLPSHPSPALERAHADIDEIYNLPHIVRPGETIASSGFDRKTGGKGSTQAYAAARAGGRVVLDAQIGSDGLAVRDRIAAGGVDVSRVRVVEDEVSNGLFGGPCRCRMAAARHIWAGMHTHER